jgi:hypothetical protein
LNSEPEIKTVALVEISVAVEISFLAFWLSGEISFLAF